jgi:hypothetical protein
LSFRLSAIRRITGLVTDIVEKADEGLVAHVNHDLSEDQQPALIPDGGGPAVQEQEEPQPVQEQ